MPEVIVELIEEEYQRLCRAVTATGGLQMLIQRLQRGIREKPGGGHTLCVQARDLPRIARYWQNTGGKPGSGGYQQRLPMQSLREYLPSVAPLYADGIATKPPVSYVYFKQKRLSRDGPIKIGRGGSRRANQQRHTDNPDELITLLKLVETETLNERVLHARFARHRMNQSQEWFWPADEIWDFIYAQSGRERPEQERRA